PVPAHVLADHKALAITFGITISKAIRGIFDEIPEPQQDQGHGSVESDAERFSQGSEPLALRPDASREDAQPVVDAEGRSRSGEIQRTCTAGDGAESRLGTRSARNALPIDPLRNFNNFSITSAAAPPSGLVAKFKGNVAAIRTLKQIEEEERTATDEEKSILTGFVGWGQFPQVFSNHPDWEQENEELQDLLDSVEFEAARASTINAHYTTPSIVRWMWAAAQRLGFNGGRVLEPALGVGYFFGCIPDRLRAQTLLTGIEMDPVSSRIATLLYPGSNITISAFQDVPHLTNFYDLVIGNVPFGDITVRRDKRYSSLKPSLHDYFILRAVDEVRQGGLIILITSRYTLDREDQCVRAALASRAELIGAFRLPCTAFKALAGTEVVTDIV
ncbi:MAG: hypothetical protein ACREAC_24950, partial [Blastocatellia bacterium]